MAEVLMTGYDGEEDIYTVELVTGGRHWTVSGADFRAFKERLGSSIDMEQIYGVPDEVLIEITDTPKDYEGAW